ncbi:MAG TPA: aspartate kinase [Candidatus Omnitrophica bacterium]|nr:aspartate kinase [Candidatus Omnitrophota bacterium]
MSVVVKKFGGTSLATPERIKRIAQRIVASKKKKDKVVIVVSALGNTTDTLISLAKQLHQNPPHRELDMLVATGEQVSCALMAMALSHLGVEAISLTGPQVGIITDSTHTRALILKVKTERIDRELKKGRIVVVAGFQGKDMSDEITTLGRGGSDTTAVALAVALNAEVCEIFTDVKGVYTADPQVVPEARKIEALSYGEMLELASSGAKVLQTRAVELGSKYGMRIHVRSSFTEKEGTIIMKELESMEKVLVRGVTTAKNEARITIHDVPDRPGVAAYIFSELSKEKINVDMIVQSSAHRDKNDISFTVDEEVLSKTLDVMEKVRKVLKAGKVASDANIGKVSVVGVGMRTHSGVAARMFQSLARENINIEMISTSEIKISCIVREDLCDKAMMVLHKEFELDKSN